MEFGPNHVFTLDDMKKINDHNNEMLKVLSKIQPLSQPNTDFYDVESAEIVSCFLNSSENSRDFFHQPRITVHEAFQKMKKRPYMDQCKPIGNYRFHHVSKNVYNVSVNGQGFTRYSVKMSDEYEPPTKRQYRGNIGGVDDLERFMNKNSMKYFHMKAALNIQDDENDGDVLLSVNQYSIIEEFTSAV